MRACDHRVRSDVGNAGDGVTAHGMAWLSTQGDQTRGTKQGGDVGNVGGALLPQRWHICFLGGGCNLHV